MCHNSSACHIYIMRVELGPSNFTLGENAMWVELDGIHFLSLVTRETGAKNNFQMKLLFITSTDYSAK